MSQNFAVGNMNAGVNQLATGGRLTLTSNTPVTVSDVTAATSVYFTPFISSYRSVYDTTLTKWITIPFTEITISVPASTSQMYDVFGYNNGGVLGCDAPVAWTNDTTRATAITLQDGVYVKSGDASRVYLGSFRTTTVSGQTEDSAAKRYVWNYYNRVNRYMAVIDTTNTWTYTLAAFRQANGSTANQLDCVIGVSEDAVHARSCGVASQGGASLAISSGIGINSTTVNSAQLRPSTIVVTGGGNYHSMADYVGFLSAGRNTLVWLESSQAAGTTTWWGDNGSTFIQTGIVGNLRG